MPDELYCYPGTNVLKNKMGIRNIEQLHEMERKLTMLRMFCNAMFLYGQAEEIFGKLKAEDHLHGLGEDDFIGRLSYYFSEINALHPFRDGKVTQRHLQKAA